MKALDLIIIFGYLIGIVLFGTWFSRKQKTTTAYFLGDRSIPWWAVAFSIVATETSTISFISVPGIAFARGGNFQFLQLVFGYLLGRIVISLLFIPAYFRGNLLTVYQLLDQRFGGRIKMLAASLFVVMRNIADGIRLLLTAIVLAAVYAAFQPNTSPEWIIIGSIILIGLAMIIFTYFGGMEAVIWVEVIQLGIYIAGAIAAAVVLTNSINGGLATAGSLATQFGKLSLFDFTFDHTRTYTFWSGLIGGCFLTMSTHGTDQYLVQRYLCTDRPRKAIVALLTSGGIVLAQFIGFLFIGVLLFAFYQPFNDPGYATAASTAFPFTGGDRVFPDFITKFMPSGLSGLVVAAIFAAAMSSSLNSIAATAVNDLYKPFRPARDDKHYLKVSHVLTVIWGVVQIGVALAVRNQPGSALSMALSIASLINGPILGVFLVGTLLKRVSQTPALIGMLVSLGSMLYVFLGTKIAWTWYVLLGSLIAFVVAWVASFAFGARERHRGVCRVNRVKQRLPAKAQRRKGKPKEEKICMRISRYLSSVLAILLIGMSVSTARPHLMSVAKAPDKVGAYKREPSKKALKWANEQLKKMSLEEKIGQLISVGVNATFLNQDSDAYKALKHQIENNKVGGIILFRGPVYESVILVNRMQQLARYPLLISADLEYGAGMRFEDTVNFPWNMAVAATGNPEYARRQGEITAREARALGVQHVFAPVVDVNNNAANPVINVRSYGEDPADVSRFAAAFTEGAQNAGVIATAKHFPGHGDTAVDSHRGLPEINVTRERLNSIEFVPFKATVDAGVGSIMVGHIALPQIDSTPVKPLPKSVKGKPLDTSEDGEIIEEKSTMPATMSPVMGDILRKDFKFSGMIVTDALSMSGLTIYFTQEEAAVRALEAGADMLLKPADVDASFRGVQQAVKSGRITEQRVEDSARKILAAKYDLGLVDQRLTAVDSIDRIVASKDVYELATEIAEDAVTLVRDEDKLVALKNLKPESRIFNLAITNGEDRNWIANAFVSRLGRSGLKVETVVLDERSTEKEVQKVIERAQSADLVLASLYGRVRSGQVSSVGIPDAGARALSAVIASKTPVVGISFGNPYLLQSFPGLRTYIVAYGDMPSLQQAVARALLGEIDVVGKLPISLPGLYPRGTGIQVKATK